MLQDVAVNCILDRHDDVEAPIFVTFAKIPTLLQVQRTDAEQFHELSDTSLAKDG